MGAQLNWAPDSFSNAHDSVGVALVGVGLALERDVAIRLLRAAVAAEAEQELRDP